PSDDGSCSPQASLRPLPSAFVFAVPDLSEPTAASPGSGRRQPKQWQALVSTAGAKSSPQIRKNRSSPPRRDADLTDKRGSALRRSRCGPHVFPAWRIADFLQGRSVVTGTHPLVLRRFLVGVLTALLLGCG